MARRIIFFLLDTNFFHLNVSNVSSLIDTRKMFTMYAGKFTLFHDYYLYNIDKGVKFSVTFLDKC